MSVIDLRRVGLLTLVAAVGCASSSAPRGFLPGVDEAQSNPYGSWVEVSYRTDAGIARAGGELIAMTPDSLWLLGAAAGRVISTSTITGGRLEEYNAGAGAVGALTAVGALSTISNGGFLIATAPMWIIGGSTAARSQSMVPLRDLEASDWRQIRPFARFPQGMPEGLSLADLERKPAG